MTDKHPAGQPRTALERSYSPRCSMRQLRGGWNHFLDEPVWNGESFGVSSSKKMKDSHTSRFVIRSLSVRLVGLEQGNKTISAYRGFIR